MPGSGRPLAPALRASHQRYGRYRVADRTHDIAELVEHEQRVIAGAAEMPVVGTAFHVLAAGQASEHRLAQQAGQATAAVPAGACLGDYIRTRVGQAQSRGLMSVMQKPFSFAKHL
jgi:hypothetical protein